jgi:hypothetical protein
MRTVGGVSEAEPLPRLCHGLSAAAPRRGPPLATLRDEPVRMKRHTPGRCIAAAGGFLAIMTWGHASRACPGSWEPAIIAMAALLAPSEFGATVASAEPRASRFVLGWSYQFAPDQRSRHRVVPSIDLLPGRNDVSWRGRLGYRYGRRHLFGGAGVGIDSAGVNLSPELGVKFLHLDKPYADGIDPSLHLLIRADVAPESGRVRGGTVLLGWNVL